MGQEKQAAAKGQESLRKATDTLSTMLAQEVKDLNSRQRAARRENSTDPGGSSTTPHSRPSASTPWSFRVFPSGAKIYFGSMQYTKDRTNYQGKAFDFIGFDELGKTHKWLVALYCASGKARR